MGDGKRGSSEASPGVSERSEEVEAVGHGEEDEGEIEARAERSVSGDESSSESVDPMVIWSSDLILARAKDAVDSPEGVRQLNLWGCGVTDAGLRILCRQLPNVEVLSLSSNFLTTLEPLAESCGRLREVYARRNAFPEGALEAVLAPLGRLKQLRTLWLGENPCCQGMGESEYRAAVVRVLPDLLELDGAKVTEAERQDALARVAASAWSLKARRGHEAEEREKERRRLYGPAWGGRGREGGIGAAGSGRNFLDVPSREPKGMPADGPPSWGDGAGGGGVPASGSVLFAALSLLGDMDAHQLRAVRDEATFLLDLRGAHMAAPAMATAAPSWR